MLRYKSDNKNKKLDRVKLTTQTISFASHLLVLFLLFIMFPVTENIMKPESFKVNLRYNKAKNEKNAVKKIKKKKKKTSSKRKKFNVASKNNFERISSSKKINLSSGKIINNGSRKNFRRNLSSKLKVTEKITSRSAATKTVKPVESIAGIGETKVVAKQIFKDINSRKKIMNLSNKLDISGENLNNIRNISNNPADDLQISLLEESTYTIMPEFLWKPAIEYPYSARKKGSEGSVNLIIEIKKDGDVGMIQLAETPLDPELANFIVKEAEKWKFKPMHKSGIPLSGNVSVKIKYVLKNSLEVNTVKL